MPSSDSTSESSVSYLQGFSIHDLQYRRDVHDVGDQPKQLDWKRWLHFGVAFLLLIVLLVGVGFGVYFVLQNSVKNNEKKEMSRYSEGWIYEEVIYPRHHENSSNGHYPSNVPKEEAVLTGNEIVKPSGERPAGTAPAYLKAALFHQTAMKPSVDPCTDFYEHACGGYVEKNAIPSHLSQISELRRLPEETYKNMKTLLESKDSSSSEAIEKMKKIFRACLKEEDYVEDAIHVAQNEIDDIGWWPMLYGENERELANFDMQKMLETLGRDHHMGAGVFSFGVERDQKNYSRRVITFDQGGLLTEMHYYLEPTKYAKELEATKKRVLRKVQQFAKDLKLGENPMLESEVEDMIRFETEVAKIMTPLHDRRDHEKQYNMENFFEFNEEFKRSSGLDLRKLALETAHPLLLPLFNDEEMRIQLFMSSRQPGVKRNGYPSKFDESTIILYVFLLAKIAKSGGRKRRRDVGIAPIGWLISVFLLKGLPTAECALLERIYPSLLELLPCSTFFTALSLAVFGLCLSARGARELEAELYDDCIVIGNLRIRLIVDQNYTQETAREITQLHAQDRRRYPQPYLYSIIKNSYVANPEEENGQREEGSDDERGGNNRMRRQNGNTNQRTIAAPSTMSRGRKEYKGNRQAEERRRRANCPILGYIKDEDSSALKGVFKIPGLYTKNVSSSKDLPPLWRTMNRVVIVNGDFLSNVMISQLVKEKKRNGLTNIVAIFTRPEKIRDLHITFFRLSGEPATFGEGKLNLLSTFPVQGHFGDQSELEDLVGTLNFCYPSWGALCLETWSNIFTTALGVSVDLSGSTEDVDGAEDEFSEEGLQVWPWDMNDARPVHVQAAPMHPAPLAQAQMAAPPPVQPPLPLAQAQMAAPPPVQPPLPLAQAQMAAPPPVQPPLPLAQAQMAAPPNVQPALPQAPPAVHLPPPAQGLAAQPEDAAELGAQEIGVIN